MSSGSGVFSGCSPLLPSDHTRVDTNEVIPEGCGVVQLTSGGGLVARRTKTCLEDWNLQPRPPGLGQGRGVRDSVQLSLANDLINPSSVMKCLHKPLNNRFGRATPVGWGTRPHTGRVPYGTEVPALGTLLVSALCASSSGRSPASFISFSSTYSIFLGAHGNLQTCNHIRQKVACGPRTYAGHPACVQDSEDTFPKNFKRKSSERLQAFLCTVLTGN